MDLLRISTFLMALMLASGLTVQAQKQKKVRSYGAMTKKSQAMMSPQQALKALKKGNKRYVRGRMKKNKKYRRQAAFTAMGQFPYATILSCVDSRVSAEEIFDLGNGDAFSGRVAGNVATPDMLGSFEFATKVAGSKVLLVLGHTSCGAVKGACDKVELGNLTGLLNRIKPAVNMIGESWSDGEKNSKNKKFVKAVGEKNVKLTMEKIKEESSVIKELVDSGKLLLVGGIYNLKTGRVRFLD